jgi:hypothetical protein
VSSPVILPVRCLRAVHLDGAELRDLGTGGLTIYFLNRGRGVTWQQLPRMAEWARGCEAGWFIA